MYIKVRILIGGDVISSPEGTAPVGIRYKGRRPQPSRGNSEEIQRKIQGESQREIGEYCNRDVSGLVGVASVSNIL